jgi:hypothetical protein
MTANSAEQVVDGFIAAIGAEDGLITFRRDYFDNGLFVPQLPGT